MKKNSGFMLFETLIVSTLVLGTLVFLYVQLSSVKRSYTASFKYNTIEGLYKAELISNYIEDVGYSNLVSSLGDSDYLDITSNCSTYLTSFCSKILTATNVNTILFTNQDISSLKQNITNSFFSKDIIKAIKYLPNTKEGYLYRILVLYNDGTTASVGVGLDLNTLNSYTLVNKITNGSFENNLSNWSVTGSTNVTSATTIYKKNGDKALSFNITSAGENKITQNISLTAGHKYYVSKYIFLDKNTTGSSDIYLNDNNKYANIDLSSLKIRKWNKTSSIFEANSSGTYTYNLLKISTATTTPVYVDNVLIIDLTAVFGASNEPDLKWCDANINYFDTSMTIYK